MTYILFDNTGYSVGTTDSLEDAITWAKENDGDYQPVDEHYLFI